MADVQHDPQRADGSRRRAAVRLYVLPGSMIFTDEYSAYERLGKRGYTHRRIKHHARVYVDGDVHTQTIDGFFGLFKTGVRGAHRSSPSSTGARLPRRSWTR